MRSALAFSAGVAGDGDLVAADVDVAGDRALDELEDLVVGAEQAHHVLRVGDGDLGLHARVRVDWIRGVGWATGHMSAVGPMPPASLFADPVGPSPTPCYPPERRFPDATLPVDAPRSWPQRRLISVHADTPMIAPWCLIGLARADAVEGLLGPGEPVGRPVHA